MVDETLTKAELQEYAAETFGEILQPQISKADMIARIQSLESCSGPELADATPESPESALQGERRIPITIHEQEGEEGNADVFLQVNGYAVQVKRGHRVEIPERFVGVLENAVLAKYTPVKNGVQRRDVKRFAYTVHTQ